MRPLMTYAELKEITTAYNGFAPIAECDIDVYYKEVFPHYCECGAEMIMTEPGHTQLQCCNPCCWVKMAYRLSYFISYHGYKGFGEASALTLFREVHDKLKYFSFLSVFYLSETELAQALPDHFAQTFLEIKRDLKERGFTFSDAVASLGIPGIGPRSTIFDVVKSPLTLLHYVLKNDVYSLCELCGIQAPITRFQLFVFKVDIVILMKDVMPIILDTPKGEIHIAITGKVTVNGLSYSRQEFIDLCESIRDKDGTQLYKIVETKAEAKLQFVIADAPSNSDKYRIGAKLGKLITADNFYRQLQPVSLDEEESGDVKV